MKFQVSFKNPDALQDAIEEAVDKTLASSDLAEDEQEAVKEKRMESVGKLCSKWFEWGEYLLVEIDTVEETIRVVPVGEEEKE